MDYELSRRRVAKLNRVRFSQSSIENDYSWQFCLGQAQYLAFLYRSGDAKFEDATERELDAMFLAYIKIGDRSLSMLNPHWSSRIRLDPNAAAEVAFWAVPSPSPDRPATTGISLPGLPGTDVPRPPGASPQRTVSLPIGEAI